MPSTEDAADIVGVIPAAGHARRIAPLPCSKELYPVGLRTLPDGGGVRPKVVAHYLLEKMRRAGVRRAYVVLREGKWDIPTYFRDGEMLDMHLAYLMTRLPFGAPYTVDQAYPFVRHALVAFGFPDILFGPEDGYEQLLRRQTATSADIVLGVFPAREPAVMEMVDIDAAGRVREMLIRPPQPGPLRHAWIFAVWGPAFTAFLHEFLQRVLRSGTEPVPSDEREAPAQAELSVGRVLQAAIRAGLRTQAVTFPAETYLDIGTPDDLVEGITANAGGARARSPWADPPPDVLDRRRELSRGSP